MVLVAKVGNAPIVYYALYAVSTHYTHHIYALYAVAQVELDARLSIGSSLVMRNTLSRHRGTCSWGFRSLKTH